MSKGCKKRKKNLGLLGGNQEEASFSELKIQLNLLDKLAYQAKNMVIMSMTSFNGINTHFLG